MGLHLKKTCPDCGEPMDRGAASRCRACYETQRSGSTLPYRGKNPLKLCPGCGQRWILNQSRFCWSCYNLRRTKAWKQSHCPPHHWILDDWNHGVCKDCGLERQFPTPKEQAHILACAFQVTKKKETALLDEELVQEIVMA